MKRVVLLFLMLWCLCFLYGQNYNMSNGTVTVSCSQIINFYDPGGPNGNYSNNQSFTQTFIAPEGQCLRVVFTSFRLESYSGSGTPYDYLTICDGANASSPQIERYYGTNSPGTIVSSNGALTFVFHSDFSGNYSGWKATITCTECPSEPEQGDCNPQSTSIGSPCSENAIQPFCTENNDFNMAYPSVTGNFNASAFLGSNRYDCLTTTPRPSWFFLQIDEPGDLLIHITQYSEVLPSGQPNTESTPIDIDFACWGPFDASSPEDFLSNLCCGFYSMRAPNGAPRNVVDCSYSNAGVEDCLIQNAQQGEWYLLLVCNFTSIGSVNGSSGYFGFSSLPMTGSGQATTNCNLLAPMTYNGPLCEGDTLVLTCTNPQTGATYNWTGPNGWSEVTTVPTVSVPNVTVLQSGEYGLQLTGLDNIVNPSHIEVIIDSMPQLTLTVSEDTICRGTQISLQAQGASRYVWLPGGSTAVNRTLTPSTTTTYTVTGSIGNCSATVSHTVVVFALPTVNITTVPSNRTICKGDTAILCASGGETYMWVQGVDTIAHTDTLRVSPAANTTYQVIGVSAEGCTKSTSKNIIVRSLPTVSISGASSVCRGDSVLLTSSSASQYAWSTGASTRSIWVKPSETSVYGVTVTDSHGCSDTATYTVTVNYVPEPEVLDVALCASSYRWHDSVYTNNGTHIFQMDNEGCPYADTLRLTLYGVSPQTYNVDTCEQYTWRVNDITYTQSGTYTYRHLTENNCWQEDTLLLTLYHAVPAVLDTTVCASSFLWHGNTYTTSDTFAFPFLDEHQCRQVDTLKIILYEVNHQSYTVDTCMDYLWPLDGAVYTQSGTYYYPHHDSNGCQQVDTLHLVIREEYETIQVVENCGPYTWIDEHTYTESTNAPTHVMQASNFCDSVIHLHLTVYEVTHEVLEKDTCSYYFWHGTRYTEGGLYTFSDYDSNNCPYTDTLLLSLHFASPSSMSAQSCGSYEWNDSVYTESGVYCHGHEDGNGCWQVDTLYLTVNRPVHGSETVLACGSYEWNGITYTQSGLFQHAVIDGHGCLQVDTLHLRLVSEPELLLLEVINASCNQDNGYIKISSSGGLQPYRYVYQPSGVEAEFNYLAAGNYLLQMIDSIGCTAEADFVIENIVHRVNLVQIANAHCGRDDGRVEIAATGGFGVYTYHWTSPIVSDGPIAEHVRAGNYSVSVVDSNGCSLPLSFTVQDIPGPDACFYFNVSNERCMTLVNCTEEEGLTQWTWSFGDGQGSGEWQPFHIYNNPGKYPVVLTVVDENNCRDSLELLYVIREEPTMYLPSAFIPESEIAENRVFKPIGNSISEQNYEMLVYDRWGELIFVSRQPDYGWDGHINGHLAPQGTYMYKINYEDVNGIPKMVKGSVLLMR